MGHAQTLKTCPNCLRKAPESANRCQCGFEFADVNGLSTSNPRPVKPDAYRTMTTPIQSGNIVIAIVLVAGLFIMFVTQQYVIVSVLTLVVLAIAFTIKDAEDKRQASRELVASFRDTGISLSSPLGALAIVENGTQLLFFTHRPYYRRTLSPTEILGAEVETHTTTLTHTKTQGRVGSALVGGALLGPIGAVAGASRGRHSTSTSSEHVIGASVKILVDDMARPILYFQCANQQEAEEWAQRIIMFAQSAKKRPQTEV